MRRVLVLIGAMLPGVAVHGQEPTIQVWITGEVTVTTSESLTLTVVRVKGRMWRDSIRSGEHHVVFRITHAKPIASKLNYTGGGRVVYRTPRSEKSAGYGPRSEKMLPRSGFFRRMESHCFFLPRDSRIPIRHTSDLSEMCPRSPSST